MNFTDKTFENFSLHPDLKAGIAQCGFTHLTPVQASGLPVVLEGKDAAVQAQTGSGKTAVFLITIFDRLMKSSRNDKAKGICPRALIMTPTRELAVQIASDAEKIGAMLPLRTLAVFGGTDYQKQRDELKKGMDILVATPGRLIDYWKQKIFHLKDVEIAVIDEADRMFDMGFIKDIRFILKRLSDYDKRQSMIFSATLSDRVMELSYEYMNVPHLVEIEPDKIVAEKVEQAVFHVGSDDKPRLLLGLLQKEEWNKAIIFINMKRDGARLSEILNANGHPNAVISGDVDQKKRLRIIKKFMSGEVRILVATDVASRGLHVENITHVFNYDVPQGGDDYVHRIGRTARTGASGKAFTLACEKYVHWLEEIEKFIDRKIPVQWPDDDMFPEIELPPRRPSRKHLNKRHPTKRPAAPRHANRGGQDKKPGASRPRRAGAGTTKGPGERPQVQKAAPDKKPQDQKPQDQKPKDQQNAESKPKRRRRRGGQGRKPPNSETPDRSHTKEKAGE